MPPLSLMTDLLVQVILPALAVAAALLFLTTRAGLAAAGPALSFAAGSAAANWVRPALPWLPEQATWHWLPWAVLAALAAGAIARLSLVPTWAGWLLRAASAALAAWLLVPTDLRIEEPWWLPALFASMLANWMVLECSAQRETGWTSAAGLAFACVGAATVLVHTHTARLADVAFMGGAALAGIALVAWWWQLDTATALVGPAVLLPGLMLSGYYETADFSDVPAGCFILIALTPLALAPMWLPPLRKLSGHQRGLVELGLLLALVLIAVGLAMRAAPMHFE